MLLLLILLTGTEILTIAENTEEEIKDGDLSRKILGQSVVTSVSVVMDIGNGTKTIFTDPLGKPIERPSSPADLASPINLLNPDRYEFYTFDDNGNLVRRLMSLEEIKGIIATGDSDGLEYDSALSESYIPEKRVNDVLSNVQNVLKEEMEIHSTKLDSLPAFDTPDVSDSWNMILPAVFGNSGVDITPEKPHNHVTPDTIMIEPNDKSQSTPRSTLIINSSIPENYAFSTSGKVTSESSSPGKVTSESSSPGKVTSESSTSGEASSSFSTFVQITSSSSPSEKATSASSTTMFGSTVSEKPLVSLITWDQFSDLNTESKENDLTLEQTTQLTTLYIPVSTIPSKSDKITNTSEMETTVSSVKTDTTLPAKTEYVKIDQIVSSTEASTKDFVTELNASSNNTLYTTLSSSKINSTSETPTATETQTTNLPDLAIQSIEPLNYSTIKSDTDGTTTETNLDDVNSIDKIAAPEILYQLLSTVNDFNTDSSHLLQDEVIINEMNRFETTSYITETVTIRNDQSTKANISTTYNAPEESSTTEISTKNTNYFNETQETSVANTISTVYTTIVPDINVSISNVGTNQSKLISNDIPVKSTKIENTNETIEEEIVKSTVQNQDNVNTTTVLVPLTIIDSSIITTTDLHESTMRVPLIDPSESKDTIRPSIGILINETRSENLNNTASVTSTEIYDESTKIITNSTASQYSSTTEKPITQVTEDAFKEIESIKKEPNWTLVPTIAPHNPGSLGVPSYTSESYPVVFDPPEPIQLKAEPLSGFGLEESTSTLDKDIYQFSQLYNELAFDFWKANTGSLSHARSLVVSPFGTISLLAMIFLGARGSTSAEMNEILKLDDMITFNPHLILKNVGESVVSEANDSNIVTSIFIKELFMCRMKGKILPFYKERVKAFYDGFAEEVNFAEIGDIIRRRTNLQVKKHSEGKIPEYLGDMSVVGRPPLVGLGVNIFQTDCSNTFSEGRDGEMHFTVVPTIRQRRLVPIPAVLFKTGFLAGYEPSLDATAVSIGGKNQTISTIFVMPGQQGTPSPGDGLARLEKSLVESSFKKGAWPRLLRSLIPRSGLEVQIPKILHRSVINTTETLKKMGFVELFKKGQADLVGMNGISNELYLSDVIQINQFTTCAEKRTEHHSEIYPNSIARPQRQLEDDSFSSFEDPLHHQRYLELPLPLRPRQARKPETPRLKFDRPFLFFVRHNPTGLILHIGRFNPRLLP